MIPENIDNLFKIYSKISNESLLKGHDTKLYSFYNSGEYALLVQWKNRICSSFDLTELISIEKEVHDKYEFLSHNSILLDIQAEIEKEKQRELEEMDMPGGFW